MDINAKYSNGNTLLHLTKNLKTAQALIASGAEMPGVGRTGYILFWRGLHNPRSSRFSYRQRRHMNIMANGGEI